MCIIKLQEGEIKFSVFQNYLVIELISSLTLWIRIFWKLSSLGTMLVETDEAM